MNNPDNFILDGIDPEIGEFDEVEHHRARLGHVRARCGWARLTRLTPAC